MKFLLQNVQRILTKYYVQYVITELEINRQKIFSIINELNNVLTALSDLVNLLTVHPCNLLYFIKHIILMSTPLIVDSKHRINGTSNCVLVITLNSIIKQKKNN